MSSGPIRAVHAVGDLWVSSGGPSRSVTAVCDALARGGAAVDLVTSWPDPAVPIVRPAEAGVRLLAVADGARSGLWQGARSAFGRAVAEAAAPPGVAVVHDHGLWLPTNRAAALAARAAGRPFVVSPKGMLSDRALRVKRAKKRLAWHLYQRRVLGLVDAFQATSEAEAADVRRAGFRQPVAVIPHGVAVPPSASPRPARAGRRTALFLSRVHPIKGLPDLVEAWDRVRPDAWRLVVAGPDEEGHRAALERQVAAAGLGGAVSFAGPVEEAAKWDLYREADLFVLPTHSENFGIVVAEALAAGLPVLTTKGAPWQALETERCGWWTDVGAEPVAAALREATAAPPEALRAMGERGRAYVAGHLSWDRAAAEHLALYQWLLGGGPRPNSVV
ncbi:glycosyltransferase [Rubrivirga litoralis]|uniref:Glycosyltransferase n=1 Tax=Rubrivirga litoralis TaxID=3075598 RepID=A0ABU3BSE7_9BACT|nr:glycosyltransferase [Rubrivirga sp. F394]MDT0632219.1 glycosyltransferase [Rubrivirga sp. F394]